MTARPPVSAQRSAWLRTAVPAPETPVLSDTLRTRALVVGAGYAGLNAALRLVEAGHDVAVVEAEAPGFGGSGRNGGQVIAGLKHDPQTLVSIFGEEQGGRLIAFAGGAAEETFALIRKYDLDCDADQCGWLQPAVDDATLRLVRRRAEAWAGSTGGRARLVDAAETERLTGSTFYRGGWIDPRGGQLQPLSYARELARIVITGGGRVYSQSRASAIRREGDGWITTVNGHEVRSDSVLVCANGYADGLLPTLTRSLIPASSVMVSTVPLPEAVRATVLPARLPVSDARRLMNYIRLDREGRLLIGARGSFGLHEPESDFRALHRAALQVFPQIEGVDWQDAWGGLFCLTADFLPHLHNPEPGLYALAGCNGRGVAILSQLGRVLGAAVADGTLSRSPLPVSDIRPIPLHGFRRAGLESVLLWYRLLDRFHV